MGKMWSQIIQYMKRGLALDIVDWVVGTLLGLFIIALAIIGSDGNTQQAVAFTAVAFIVATPFLWIFRGWLMGVIVQRVK